MKIFGGGKLGVVSSYFVDIGTGKRHTGESLLIQKRVKFARDGVLATT